MSKFHRKTYSESFKLEVLRDYYVSGLSMNSTAKKWGLTSNTYISRWQKCYPIDSELLSLSSEPISQGQMKNDPKSREQILEEENLRLKKALETEKLRSRAFQQLIELTEKEEGISILKNTVYSPTPYSPPVGTYSFWSQSTSSCRSSGRSFPRGKKGPETPWSMSMALVALKSASGRSTFVMAQMTSRCV